MTNEDQSVSEFQLRQEIDGLRAQLSANQRELSQVEARAQRAERQAERVAAGRAAALIQLRRTGRQERWSRWRLGREVLRWLARESLRSARRRRGGSEPQAPTVRTVKRAMSGKRYDEALALLAEVGVNRQNDPEYLAAKWDVHNRRGEIADALAAAQRLRRVSNSPEVRRQLRFVAGRWVESDPAWRPRIAGPPRPVVPRSPSVALHLLKESLPYHHNGFCMRSHYSLLAQRAAGIEPVVVTAPGFPRRAGVVDFPIEETIDGITHHRLDFGPGYPVKAPFDDYLRDYAWAAGRLAREIRPAVIHAGSGHRGYETALIGLALRDHLRLPLVYEVRSFFETTWTGNVAWSERGEYYQRRFETENRCMRAADVVITIGDAMRDEIVARGVDPDRVFVAPNGVDPAGFSPRPRSPELAKRYGLVDGPTFGYVSTLDHPRESQETLIRATAVLRARRRKATCVIVGDGRRRESLEALAKAEGVADRVVFTGRVPHDEIADYYALLDVFVVPRTAERAARLVTPLKPFEAMAMELPVVVSELPALTEIAAPEERGLSFPPDDAVALAGQLERLFDDPGLRSKIGQAGRNWVVRERTWLANGPRYVEAYQAARDRWASTMEA